MNGEEAVVKMMPDTGIIDPDAEDQHERIALSPSHVLHADPAPCKSKIPRSYPSFPKHHHRLKGFEY